MIDLDLDVLVRGREGVRIEKVEVRRVSHRKLTSEDLDQLGLGTGRVMVVPADPNDEPTQYLGIHLVRFRSGDEWRLNWQRKPSGVTVKERPETVEPAEMEGLFEKLRKLFETHPSDSRTIYSIDYALTGFTSPLVTRRRRVVNKPPQASIIATPTAMFFDLEGLKTLRGASFALVRDLPTLLVGVFAREQSTGIPEVVRMEEALWQDLQEVLERRP